MSHNGEDQVGRSVAHALEETTRTSQRFSLVAVNAEIPRIIILVESVEALTPPLKGRVSAIAYSIIYCRTGMPGVGVFLGISVNGCGPEIIESCARNVLPHLERAVEFLRKHDPDLWKTL